MRVELDRQAGEAANEVRQESFGLTYHLDEGKRLPMQR